MRKSALCLCFMVNKGISALSYLLLCTARKSSVCDCIDCFDSCVDRDPTFSSLYDNANANEFFFRIQLDKMYEEDGAQVCKECWPHTKEDLIPVYDIL